MADFAPCPYHSTVANGMQLFGPSHPCFTVYAPTSPGGSAATTEGETHA